MVNRPTNAHLSGLYPIIDTKYVSLNEAAQKAETILKIASGSVGIIQLRAKESDAGELIRAARELRAVTLKYNALFIVNDRIDVTLMSEADGVHLGQEDVPITEARALLGPDMIIGLSTHNIEEALEAVELGADYISFGPIFKTRTKTDARTPGGTKGLSKVSRALKGSNIGIVAIGGITNDNASEVLKNGASMAALISHLLLSKDISTTIKELLIKIGPSSPLR
ncbi:MAG: thiamine phosphate synthase [Thermodesulfobacteriota bacterium]